MLRWPVGPWVNWSLAPTVGETERERETDREREREKKDRDRQRQRKIKREKEKEREREREREREKESIAPIHNVVDSLQVDRRLLRVAYWVTLL